MIKGNPQAREGKFVCSEGHAVVHQIWQKPPILPGLTYLTDPSVCKPRAAQQSEPKK